MVVGIFNITHRESQGKYLGCLVFQQWANKNIFQGIIHKEATKLEGWKANYLSKAERTVLIQSHLEALPVRTMQCFQLPKAITLQLARINREFLGKNNNTEKGLNLIAWDKICMPKVKGRLGLRKTEAINKVFQCKLAWIILTDEEIIWIREMRIKYLKQLFKESIRLSSLEEYVELSPRKGLVRRVEKGNKISFCYDNRIETQNLVDIPGIEDGSIVDLSIKVSEFICNAQWDIQKLNQTLQGHQIIPKIIGIALPVI